MCKLSTDTFQNAEMVDDCLQRLSTLTVAHMISLTYQAKNSIVRPLPGVQKVSHVSGADSLHLCHCGTACKDAVSAIDQLPQLSSWDGCCAVVSVCNQVQNLQVDQAESIRVTVMLLIVTAFVDCRNRIHNAITSALMSLTFILNARYATSLTTIKL